MTRYDAIHKARTADLQKELGVRIDSTGFMTSPRSRWCQLPDLSKVSDFSKLPVIDTRDPNAEEHANKYLASLFEVARDFVQEEDVSVLYAAELKWVGFPDEGDGSYGTYYLHLLAPHP